MSDLKYTARDFATIRAQMIGDIPNKTPEWTNLNTGELGIALLELMAGGLDILSFGLDSNALETFLDTAIAKPNVQNILRGIGYEMRRRTAATATLTLQLSLAHSSPITIPAGTVFSTANGVLFCTRSDATFDIGITEIQVPVYQGTYRVDGPYPSTGADEQTFPLSYTDVADNFLDVYVNGVLWTEEKKVFPFPTLLTTIYRATEDIDNIVSVLFNKYLGSVPAGGQSVEFRYVSTDADAGNIGAGLITTVVTSLSLPGGRTIAVLTASQAGGGQERETVAEARVNGPRSLRTLERAVTVQDFKDLLLMNGAVESVNAINHSGFVEIYVRLQKVLGVFPVFKVEAPIVATIVEGAGGTIGVGTFYIAVTAVDLNGRETSYHRIASSNGATLQNPASITTSGASKKITIQLGTAPVGAVTFNVYGGSDPASMFQIATGVLPAAIVSSTYDITAIPGSGPLAPEENLTGAQNLETSRSYYQDLFDNLEQRRLLCTKFELYDTTASPITVALQVLVEDNFKRSDVSALIAAAVDAFFNARPIGYPFYRADLLEFVRNEVLGIRNLVITAPISDTSVGNGSYATLATLTQTLVGGIS